MPSIFDVPERVKLVWGRMPLPHRASALAFAGLVMALGFPWLEYMPFMDGFMSSQPRGPVTMHGLDPNGLPGLVPAGVGLLGLVSLIVVRNRFARSVVGCCMFGLALAWSVAFLVTGGLWTCILCDVTTVLWGAYATAGIALAGMSVMAYDLLAQRARGKTPRAAS